MLLVPQLYYSGEDCAQHCTDPPVRISEGNVGRHCSQIPALLGPPLFVTLIPQYPPIFAKTGDLFTFSIFSIKLLFSPYFFLFFQFVQLSIVMQALLLNPPQPPFPDLPGFLPGIITFFLPTILATFLWEIITLKISFKNYHFLSTIHSRFLWGIISFFSRYRKQECLILTKFLFHFLPPGTSLEISLKANVDSKWD